MAALGAVVLEMEVPPLSGKGLGGGGDGDGLGSLAKDRTLLLYGFNTTRTRIVSMLLPIAFSALKSSVHFV